VFDTLWSQLDPIGRDRTSGGYRRFAWTVADTELREWFAATAADRGLDVTVDRAGNQWAWLGNPDAQPGIVLGSHLDSVPDGGAFDGPLGVVSAFLALDALRAKGVAPNRPVGIANFGDEEGARFGIACAGSRLLAGALAPDRALALRDADGTTMYDAAGALAPDPEALARIGTYVELHVEQGRGLVGAGRPVAVGTMIWPHGRWRIDLPGTADHAGTTALADRDDPMLSLASLVQAARAAAVRHDALATCGKVVVRPNGVNAIPSHVTAWLDARGADAGRVRAVLADVTAAATGLGGTVAEESWTDTTTFDAGLAFRLSALLDEAPLQATGAGHDAGVLAAAGIPTAMLFVRNPTGVSHSPAEHAERDDCLAGVGALATVLEELAR
jgi:N-carbamoyl-L-amino-acid hydrolase